MPAAQKPRSGGATEDIIKALENLAVPVTYPRAALIFEQGEPASGIFLVRKGAVRMTIKSGKTDILMRIAREGSVLGLPATMSGHPYSLTARAMQTSELGFVEREALIAAVRKNPALGLQILQMLSEDVRTARLAMASSRKTSAAHA